MRSGSAEYFDIIVEHCIRMCTEEHVARAIDNSIYRVSGAVIQNFVDGFIGALCGGGLL